MNIGRMDKRIELRAPTETSDGAGGFSTTWATVATVWAEFVKPRVAAIQDTGAIISEMNREIKIRIRTDICKGWKVGYGLKTFDVQHTYEDGRSCTVLVCREVVR